MVFWKNKKERFNRKVHKVLRRARNEIVEIISTPQFIACRGSFFRLSEPCVNLCAPCGYSPKTSP